MPQKQQRDFIIEGEDQLIVSGDTALQSVIDRLPATPLLSVSDISAALDISRDVVYAWIDSGEFRIFRANGGDRNFYKAFRSSFIEFLKSRIN